MAFVESLSFPSWERGLKHTEVPLTGYAVQSFPSWERGLKQIRRRPRSPRTHVVPLVGTWIETVYYDFSWSVRKVVPLVGTWIETSYSQLPNQASYVVPLVGTWIETVLNVVFHSCSNVSFPSWERGLKPSLVLIYTENRWSFPSWERGLKLCVL